ncbi:MAG: DUF4838 domain-containing protein [Clostridia bacterium]|nr:DUF4838 domain-containing protein [Clostridia bacterium]
MSSNIIRVFKIGKDEVVGFSAGELAKYLLKISRDRIEVIIENKEAYSPDVKEGIWVGECEDLNLSHQFNLKDVQLDDGIYICVENGNGIISGVNPRSVLLAVYRFLSEAGCRWVRPGERGEFLPRMDLGKVSVKLCETPSYRHRGICIEGAVSYENVEEIIEWAPKVGFNAYFIQFREAFAFFDRWYNHRNNPFKKPEGFSIEKAREYVAKIETEIKKRGLLYHAVGHGWTCEPLGLPGLDWETKITDIPPGVEPYLAEIKGERVIWQGLPLNTNLCYSKQEVRDLVVNDIVTYLKEHGNIDILHFWLADGMNNQCECEECRKIIPSDFYVMMLNQLDELLTKENLKTKVVFLLYVDLLWAPMTEKIKNPDRFILMFAPITRTYSHSFSPEGKPVKLSPYERNQLKFPTSVDENLAFLNEWKKMFTGDGFDFDYHFMWDHYNDPGYYSIAELLSEDIKNLKKIGLNGYMSCQVQRAFFPTGLGMVVMGKTLWNDKTNFNDLADDYFVGAFGEEGALCKEYLKSISDLFDPPFIRGEKKGEGQKVLEKLAQIPHVISRFQPVIERNLKRDNLCWATSWNYLWVHSKLCILLAEMITLRIRENKEKTQLKWDEVKKYLQLNEDKIQPGFDVFEAIAAVEIFNNYLMKFDN